MAPLLRLHGGNTGYRVNADNTFVNPFCDQHFRYALMAGDPQVIALSGSPVTKGTMQVGTISH